MKICVGLIDREAKMNIDMAQRLIELSKYYDFNLIYSQRTGISHARTSVLLQANQSQCEVMWFIDTDVSLQIRKEDIDRIVDKVIHDKAVVVNPVPNARFGIYLEGETKEISFRNFFPIKRSGFWSVWIPLPLEYYFHDDCHVENGQVLCYGEDMYFYDEYKGPKYAYLVPAEHIKDIHIEMSEQGINVGGYRP